MSRSPARLAGLLMALAASVAAPVATAATPEYLLDVWQLEEGLPQISVWDVVQGDGGYVWVATEEGLARFDGLRFEIYDRRSSALPGNFVLTLLPDGDTLWVGTTEGLAHLVDDRFTLWTEADGLPHDEVRALLRDRDGKLWIGTAGGLARRDGEGIETVTTGERLSESIRALYEDRRGRVWVGTDGGFGSWDGDRFTTWTVTDGLVHSRVDGLYLDDDGVLWIATPAGLQTLADGRISPPRPELADVEVYSFLKDPEGPLWIGTKNGLVRYAGGTFSRVTAADGLPDEHVWALWRDFEGGLWLGTRYGGLARLRKRRIDAFGTPEGLVNDLVWSVTEDPDRNVWIATDGGLDRLRPDGTLDHFSPADGLPAPDVGALLVGREGELWIGTFGDGLVRYRDGTFEVFDAGDGVPPTAIRCLYEDRRGVLWLGTNAGLTRYRDGTFTTFTHADGLPHDQVRGVHELPSGELWAATMGGMARYRPGASPPWEAVGHFEGRIKSSYLDAGGTFWLGTWDHGLARFRDGTYRTFTGEDGLPDRVHQVLEDRRGWLWMSSNRGLFRVAKAGLEALVLGHTSALETVAYGEHDGMRSRECNGASHPAGWMASDGRLWFPTIRGAVIVDPEGLASGAVAPPVHVEAVLVDQRRMPAGGSLVVPPGAREFEFRYTAIGFRRPELIRFRYRLEGFDKDWIDAGTRRAVQYTNLDPGDYRFRVVARGTDGLWNTAGDTIELVLTPAFYQTFSFYVVAAVVLALGGRGVYRLRVRSLVRRNAELLGIKSELERKNKEVEAKNAELESFAYTVSHDLKSPVFTIEGFLGLLERDIDAGDRERVRGDVSRIRSAVAKMSQLLHDLLELSRIGRVVNPVETVDLGELTSEVLELLSGRIGERGVVVEVASGLPSVTGDRPRLREVLQNLIDNAVKYMGPQPAPRIEVSAVQRNGEVVCRVADNGQGIDPRYHEKAFGLFEQLEPEAEGTGVGLALVKRIVEFHGGRIWVESEGRGKGSAFTFTLPAAAGPAPEA